MSLEALALALKGLSLEEIKALPVEQQEAIISAFPPGAFRLCITQSTVIFSS